MGEKGAKATSKSSQSAEALENRLTGLGDIRVKKMFGGHGIFHEDKMFALIDRSGGVFFKVDETNQARFDAAGSEKHGRMPYYAVPDAVLADDALLQEWARGSITISKGK